MKPSEKSDVKPHNFVLNRAAHVQLIDFGSAAPLVPGSRLVPPEYCRVPCGTCDYISPEILQAHESALVAMEMSDEEPDDGEVHMSEGGYGVETDWWSTGAMIYEMTYGVAPFFARDIRSTYLKIIDFRASLTFNMNLPVSSELQDLLIQYVRTNCLSLMLIDCSSSLLTDAQVRLGRHGTKEIMQHPFFDGTMWETLHSGTEAFDLLLATNYHVGNRASSPRAPPSAIHLQRGPFSGTRALYSWAKTRTEYDGIYAF